MLNARALVNTRALGIIVGYAADRLFGDPRRLHPVAGFGRLSEAVEKHVYGDSRIRGAFHTMLLVAGAIVLGAVAERSSSKSGIRMVATAAATWTVLGGRSLEREAGAVRAHLTAGDLPAARERVKRLVGRDTQELDACEISRAVIESVAENTSDAVVAPLTWGAIAGIPGLLGYRAANTLDAMIGHRSTRYENYGWAAARFDDILNLPGSRLSGLLTLAATPKRAREAGRVWRRDAGGHPSPNAGVVEAAFAGSLGIQLGGTNRYYGDRIEHRAVMGDGRTARSDDILTANRLARRVGFGAVIVTAAASVLVDRRCIARAGSGTRGQNACGQLGPY